MIQYLVGLRRYQRRSVESTVMLQMSNAFFGHPYAATVLLASTVISSPVWAGEAPLYQPAPMWVAPAPPVDPAKAPSDGTALVVLDQQHRLADGERWSYLDHAVRATSAEMLRQMGTITLPWHPAKGDLIIHRAEIIRSNETVDLIAKGAKFTVLQREQQLEQQTLTGILSATMTVEGLRVGDIMRVAYSVTYKDPAMGGQVETASALLAEPMRAQFARARFLWPASANVRFRLDATAPAIKPVRKGNFQELSIALPLAKQPEMPEDAPPRFIHPPIVEVSSFSSWSEVSRTAARLYRTEGLIAPGSALAAEVAKIVAAESEPRKRVAMALRLVQDEVRYLFRGMDQGNYLPQNPAQTWEVRYGDCKAKTLLLLAMLHAMNIDAEPVLASTAMGDWLSERLPSFNAFDHIFVRAQVDGKTLWLDGTQSGARYEDLEDTPPLYQVLPVRAQGAELLPIQMRPKARPDVVVDLEVDQSAGISFPAPYKITMTVRGLPADMLRLATAQAGAEGEKEAVQGLVAHYTNQGTVVSRSVSFDEAAGTAKIEAAGLANFTWRKSNERYRITLDNFINNISFEPDRSRPAWQDIPVTVPQRVSQVVRTRLHLPEEGKAIELEGDATLSGALAGFNIARTSKLDGRWLTFEERIAQQAIEIPADRIAAERERMGLAETRAFRAVAPEAYPARWQEVMTAKSQKRFGSILAMYQKAIDGDPDEVSHYRNRAVFLSAIYERRQAIADLDEVIKREPDLRTYLWRARLWTELGEKNKALADLDAARKLDPSAFNVINELAWLYLDREESKAALQLLDERIAVGGNDKHGFMALKADILGMLGRAEEAVKIYDTAIASRPGSPMLLNGRCWLKGTRNFMLDTALKDCTKAIELMQSPAAALDSRAMVYYRMGQLEDALADLDAAYSHNQMNAGTLFMRGVIRAQLGQKKDAELDLAAARLISPRIDEEYAKYGIKP